MPFNPAQPKTPTSIGKVTIVLGDTPAGIDVFGNPVTSMKSAVYDVAILDQNGHRMNVTGDAGDLVPYLTSTDIAWLLDFMSRLRTKAETEFLGATP